MSNGRYTLGRFVIDFDGESLSCDDETIHLKPQVFAVLAFLVANHESLVTREAIIDHLWGRCEVDFDANLNTIMLQIRRALGDTAGAARYIETVPRKGYRVVANVSKLNPGSVTRRKISWRSLAAAAMVAVALATTGLVVPHAASEPSVSTNTQLFYARGKEALQNGEFDRAVELLQQAVEASPEFASGHACLALAYMGQGHNSESSIARAKQQLDRARAIDPDGAMLLTVSAQIALTHDRQLDVARALLDRALAQDTADSHTHVLSAWHYSATGEHARATRAIRAALLIDPLSPGINRSAAAIYEAAGDSESAQRFSELASDLTSRT